MTRLIKKLSEPNSILSIGIIYTLFITVLLLVPTTEIPQIKVSYIDKLAHLLIHSLLSLIWLWYRFSGDKYHISVKNVFVVLFICFSYGVVIEVSQHWFTLSRNFDLYDIVANGFGSLLGLLYFWIIKSKIIQ